MQNASRDEAERLLGIAEKLLQNRDLSGARDFAILAQETEPLLEGSDQVLAIVDVILAAEKPVNNRLDWYGILQVDRRSEDHDFIRKQYRRLALLLQPEKNRFSLADHAFNLVADAWGVLSDPHKKSLYDKELAFSPVDLAASGSRSGSCWIHQDKLPVRKDGPGPCPSVRDQGFNPWNGNNAIDLEEAEDDVPRRESSTFWTACPYCYLMYEYPGVYEGCCLRCQNCERSFHGVLIQSLPPLVPGREAYYCCWGFFPMGFAIGNLGSEGKGSLPPPTGFPNRTPPPVSATIHFGHAENGRNNGEPATVTRATPIATAKGVSNGIASGLGSTKKKRGRPRKLPLLSRTGFE